MDWLKSCNVGFHEFRSKGIGSSDAPVIMGVSPWKSIYELWLEKRGLSDPQEQTSAMTRGIELEASVKDWYNEKFKCNMMPERISVKENEVLRANFDGIDHKIKRAIEIKCPNKEDHQKAAKGIVPEKYYPQVQWLLMVSGYEELDYVSFNETYEVVTVLSNKAYQDEMKSKALNFWDHVLNNTNPTTDDIAVKELSVAVNEYSIVSSELKKLTEQKEKIIRNIERISNKKDIETELFSVKNTTRGLRISLR